ncbi:MAG: radical SAM protein [Candidatus Peregrinibacteria bacterium]
MSTDESYGDSEEPPDLTLTNEELEVVSTKIFQCNERGDRQLVAFLRAPQINHDPSRQPITSTLCPKDNNGGGTVFELCPQVGCVVRCKFCGCGEFRGNLTPSQVVQQIRILLKEAEKNGIFLPLPHQIDFSDGGELLLNPRCREIFEAVTTRIPASVKISTTLPLPGYPVVEKNLVEILNLIETYRPQVKFQISLSSTNPETRQKNSRVPLFPFERIREIGENILKRHSNHRKTTLTFTLLNDSRIIPKEIVKKLPPDFFVIRLHPYKPNNIDGHVEAMDPQEVKRLDGEFRALGYKTIFETPDFWERDRLRQGGTKSLK